MGCTGSTLVQPTKPTMTARDVLQHNENYPADKLVVLFIRNERRIYSLYRTVSYFSPKILEKRRADPHGACFLPDPYLPLSYAYNIQMLLGAYNIPWCKIHEVPPACYIANVAEPSKEEIMRDMANDVIKLKESIEEEYGTDIPESISVYLSTLSRCMSEKQLNNTSCTQEEQKCNLNTLPFQLPNDIDGSDYRSFLHEWEEFDTSIDGEVAWKCLPFIDVGKLDATTKDTYWSSLLDKRESFDTTVDGEVAWKCLPFIDVGNLDVIENPVWDTHDSRKKLHRRKALSQYFMNKYEYSFDHMQTYLQFSMILQQHWETFMKLCNQTKS